MIKDYNNLTDIERKILNYIKSAKVNDVINTTTISKYMGFDCTTQLASLDRRRYIERINDTWELE